MPTLREATTAALDHRLALAQRDGRVPALTAGIVRGGELLWSAGAGAVDGTVPTADTQFRMGSITKTFVAVAILRLRDAGRLDLTDRFGAHVPGSAFGEVTIEQLLTHSGGVQAETAGPWWERTPGGSWPELAGSVGQSSRAGRRFHYTNVGYAALGRLIEVLTGRDWYAVLAEDLLTPLGLTRTTLRPAAPAAAGWAVHPFADVVLPEPEHDAGAMAPAGQLWSTVNDLGRWAAFLAGHTAGLLSPQTLAEMCEPHHVVDEPGEPWTGAHGLGWQVWNLGGTRYAGHGGSMPGFLAGLRVRVDTGDGVVALLNTTSSPATRTLIGDLHDILTDLEPPAVQPWVPGSSTLDHTDHLDLVGTWHWGPATTTARLEGAELVLGDLAMGRGSRFALVGADRWVGLDGYHNGEPLRVVRRADGSVSHLDLQTFLLTRTPYDGEADIPGGVDEGGWR